MEQIPTKVITGLVRFSYAHVFEPKAVNAGSDEKKYSVCILIRKDDEATLKKIDKAIKAAISEGMTSKFSGKAKNLKMPLRDGDDEHPEDEAYEGMMFINLSSKTKPGIVDLAKNEITSEEDFYSGCYGRASINFYAFNTNGNKGIAAGLNNLQKVKDGDRLSGGASAQEDFDDDFFDEEEDDLC